MAKRGEKTKASSGSTFPKINLSFKDERLRILLGLFSLLIAFLLCLSFFSFFFTWDRDQSQLDIPFLQYMLDSSISVDNWGAKIGAKLSKFFIHDTFGLASFSFVFIFVLLGFRFLKYRLLPLRLSLKIAVLWTIVASFALGYIFGQTWDANIGGAHGYFVTHWIASLIGTFPTGFVTFIVVFGATVYSVPGSLDFIKRNLFQKSILLNETDTDLSNEHSIGTDQNTEDESSTDTENHTGTEHSEDGTIRNSEIAEESDTPKPVENDGDVLEFSVSERSAPKKSASNSEPEFSFEHAQEPDPVEITEEKTEHGPDFDITNAGLELEMAKKVATEAEGDYDPTAELSHYRLPLIELLEDYKSGSNSVTEDELVENKNKIVETLLNYKIQIDKIKATIGPTVTLYEIVPAPGIRISKIKNLEDDIALSLAALGIRIIAPIPGKGTIGIEVPNQHPEIVSMRSIIASKMFQDTKYDLPLALGKTISNETFCADLAKMPHLLIAGATGQGKSVGLNAILTSLLYKKHPSQLKFVLVDPKKVELTLYQRIENHYLAKLPDEEESIITDTQKVVDTLNSLCIEMDERYELLKIAKQRNIKEYNAKFIKRGLNPVMGHRFLPYIVVVIDEFADLIMTAGKEVELPLARLAQLARAIGIHLIIATQRPTTNIITGVIKANFPSRIAFRVSSSMDSRTILDSPGANQLIGKGDMLISQGSDMVRVQCAFVDTPELEHITEFIGKQQSYGSPMELPEYTSEESGGVPDVDLGKRDSLFDDAARLLVIHQQGSTSLIQRKFSIGYNRAGRIVDQLEVAGILGPFEGSKARQVLIADEASLEQLLSTLP